MMNVTEQTPAITSTANTIGVRGYTKPMILYSIPFHCRDPAARRIGLILFITLTAVTIGAALGIGLGNIAHSRE